MSNAKHNLREKERKVAEQLLAIGKNHIRSRRIAKEIDMSPKEIGIRLSWLADRGLVEQYTDESQFPTNGNLWTVNHDAVREVVADE